MKKIFSGLLAIILLTCGLLTLSGCSAAPMIIDLETTKQILESHGYTVSYSSNEGNYGVEESLYAYKGDDYLYIGKCANASIAKLYYKGIKTELDQEIEYLKLEIKMDKRILSTQKRDMTNQQIREYEDEIKEMELELKEYKKNWTIGKTGKYVWYGTKNTISDSWY